MSYKCTIEKFKKNLSGKYLSKTERTAKMRVLDKNVNAFANSQFKVEFQSEWQQGVYNKEN